MSILLYIDAALCARLNCERDNSCHNVFYICVIYMYDQDMACHVSKYKLDQLDIHLLLNVYMPFKVF